MAISSYDYKRWGGSKIIPYVAAITVNLGIISCEMHYGWSSPYLPVLRSGNYTFTISSTEESYLAVIPLTGAILGATLSSLVVDYFGRKKLVVWSSIPLIISWLLVGFANSSTYMFIGRFIAGLADGLSFTAVPMYLGEIAEPKTRGFIVSVCSVCIILGLLIVSILGAICSLSTTSFLALIFPVLLLLTFYWMPESPYFFAMKGKLKEAERSLQIFRGKEDVKDELSRIQNAVKTQEATKGKFVDLFTIPSNRKALVIALGLRAFQQLTGTTVFIYYCQTIFEQARDFMSPSISSIVYFTVQLVMSIVSSAIVDFSGRRPLLIVSTIGTGLMLLTNGIYLYLQHCDCTNIVISKVAFIPVVSLLCLVVVFSIGLQTIPLLMVGEMFPTDVKAFALCLVDITYSVVVTIVSKYFHWTNENFGMHVPFFTFTGCCVLGLVFIVLKVPETKRKTLEDIQTELRGESKVLDTKMLDEAVFY